MKLAALAFLAVAAAVFVASYTIPGIKGNGFLQTGAEAGMVGGLADWFAVTALFRRPLGLPIPHTALIPTRKDALAESLGDFVTTTFLTRENVAERLADADVVTRVAQWLVLPDNAQRLARELAAAAEALAESLDPGDLADVALAAARVDVARRAYAPLLGRLLQTTLDDDAHQAMTDIVVTSVHRWLADNRSDVVLQLRARASDIGPLMWLFTTRSRVDKLVGSVISYLGEAAHDRDHDLRVLIDRLLRVLAIDLQDESPIARQVNVEAMRVLDDPALGAGWSTSSPGPGRRCSRHSPTRPARP
jgi:uncharacterized membrane-anchored protein YjiN (DUF445 family)